MPSEWSAYFLGGIVISLIMTAIWLARLKAKGKRAIVMAMAFLAFAGLLQGFRLALSGTVLWVLGSAVALLLVTDVVLRLAEEPRKE
ncbi:MAG: hypothetical protein IH944_11675 [Armatimonadetes bacterium]|nr:hypothetical protein [Armatimonadota bacterium]